MERKGFEAAGMQGLALEVEDRVSEHKSILYLTCPREPTPRQW